MRLPRDYKTSIRFSIVAEREQTYTPGATIMCSRDAVNVARRIFPQTEIQEEMKMILLNRANRVIGYADISKGGVDTTVCDPKIIAFYAVNTLTSSVILVHNHPSGNPRPSELDRKQTKVIRECLSVFNIDLLDHLILTDTNYLSFCDEGF